MWKAGGVWEQPQHPRVDGPAGWPDASLARSSNNKNLGTGKPSLAPHNHTRTHLLLRLHASRPVAPCLPPFVCPPPPPLARILQYYERDHYARDHYEDEHRQYNRRYTERDHYEAEEHHIPSYGRSRHYEREEHEERHSRPPYYEEHTPPHREERYRRDEREASEQERVDKLTRKRLSLLTGEEQQALEVRHSALQSMLFSNLTALFKRAVFCGSLMVGLALCLVSCCFPRPVAPRRS